MKFPLKSYNLLRSLTLLFLVGNIIVFYIVPSSLAKAELIATLVLYNLLCAILIIHFSRKKLFVEVLDDCLIINGLLSRKTLKKSSIYAIEVQTFEKNKLGNVCKLAVKGMFPITLYEDRFESNSDFREFLDRLKWVDSKYSSTLNTGFKALTSTFKSQPATYLLSFLMFFASSVLFLKAGDASPLIIKNFAFSKHTFFNEEYYRAFTAFFLHINPFHLLINLISLGILGGILEKHLGTVKCFNIIVISILFGWTFSYIFSEHSLVVGASGGVMGLLGAFVALKLTSREKLQPSVDIMPHWWIVTLSVIQVLSDIYSPTSDFPAHLGGFIGGGCYFLFSIRVVNGLRLSEKILSLVFLSAWFFSTLYLLSWLLLNHTLQI